MYMRNEKEKDRAKLDAIEMSQSWHGDVSVKIVTWIKQKGTEIRLTI